MIRVLLGSALPVLGIGAAAAFLGPDLLTGPRGEPLIVAAPDQAMLQPASLKGDSCAATLHLAGVPDDSSGTRVVVLTLPSEPDDVAVAVEDFPRLPAAPKTVMLVFDEAGRLIAVGDPRTLQMQAAAALADCVNTPAKGTHKPV